MNKWTFVVGGVAVLAVLSVILPDVGSQTAPPGTGVLGPGGPGLGNGLTGHGVIDEGGHEDVIIGFAPGVSTSSSSSNGLGFGALAGFKATYGATVAGGFFQSGTPVDVALFEGAGNGVPLIFLVHNYTIDVDARVRITAIDPGSGTEVWSNVFIHDDSTDD